MKSGVFVRHEQFSCEVLSSMLSILSVFCLLLVVSFGEESASDFTYTESHSGESLTRSGTEYLGGKKTNVYHISEFSNVCFNNGEFHLFGESGRGAEQTGADIQSAGRLL